MPLIFQIMFAFLTLIFTVIDAGSLSQIEQTTFEARVKTADTILFGRFNWAVPISNTDDHLNEIHSFKQNTFEFIVYCTIKRSQKPDNVPRLIGIEIDDVGTRIFLIISEDFFFIEFLDTELDMKKNTWFILFPKEGHSNKIWIIDNRTDAFDLEDDLELRIFEQFCFLKPKLPIGKNSFNQFLLSSHSNFTQVFQVMVCSIVVQSPALNIV